MDVQMNYKDGTLIAMLNGEIDHHKAPDIREAIDLKIESVKPKTLVLDYTGVSFMDSSGIGLVMGRYKLMKEIKGKIVISNPSSHISRVMKLAGLDRLAQIEKNTNRGEIYNDVKRV